MSTEKALVVKLDISVVHHKEKELVAARFRDIGLTAYGRSEDQAVSALAELFVKFAQTHHDAGNLSNRLNKAQVTWYWKDKSTLDAWEPISENQRTEQVVAVI